MDLRPAASSVWRSVLSSFGVRGERATLLPGPTLVFELRLRNRQTILGNVLEDIAHVTATATIAPLTCQVTAWSVESNNDLYNAALPLLTEEIERELATLEAQCREVLPG